MVIASAASVNMCEHVNSGNEWRNVVLTRET